MTYSVFIRNVKNSSHNLNSCLLKLNTAKMSFNMDGIKLIDLKALLPIIWPKLPPELSVKLKEHFELIIADGNDALAVNLIDFVQSCCEYTPDNFEEYVAYVMIAASIELLSVPSALFRIEKSRLMAHTFNTFNGFWGHDQEKVSKYTFNLLIFLKLIFIL